jgi:hypothetical protein
VSLIKLRIWAALECRNGSTCGSDLSAGPERGGGKKCHTGPPSQTPHCTVGESHVSLFYPLSPRIYGHMRRTNTIYWHQRISINCPDFRARLGSSPPEPKGGWKETPHGPTPQTPHPPWERVTLSIAIPCCPRTYGTYEENQYDFIGIKGFP